MATKNAFNIDLEIAAWRKSYSKKADIWPTELDELESHVREMTEAFASEGHSDKEAFRRAIQTLGSPEELATAYRENRYADTVRGQAAKYSHRIIPGLLLNYVRSAFRGLKRSGMYTFIASFGLAIALACCAWILIYVSYELKYDQFHDRSEHIVRLAKGTSANTPERWLPALQSSVAGIENGVRIMNGAFEQTVFNYDGLVLPEAGGIFADNSIFDVFSWKLALGSSNDALSRPYTIVISRDLIKRYDLPANPIGASIEISGIQNSAARQTYEVTGVLAPEPGSSHISFDYILSLETVVLQNELGEWGTPFSWTNRTLKTYLLLQPAVDRTAVQDQIASVLRSAISDPQYVLDDLELQNVESIHLESAKRSEFPGGGSLRYVYLLSALALIVLIMAVVNFVNLATARAFTRSKEIGMRKAIGATRGQIRLQYMLESLAISFISMVVGIGLAYLMKGFVFQVTQSPLSLSSLFNPISAIGIVSVTICTGIASGLYPALILSRYEPVDALKPSSSSKYRLSWLRKGLIVFQFAAAIALVATTLIMQSQMRFVESRPLGYSPENVVVVQFGHSTRITDNIESILSRLRSDTRIVGAATSHSLPTSFLNSFTYKADGAEAEQGVSLGNLALDSHLMGVLDIEVLAGRTFRLDDPADSLAFVLNESGARAFGWEPDETAIGRIVHWEMGEWGFSAPVIGIVKDFHYGSMHSAISPIVFNLSRFGTFNLLLKVRPENATAVLDDLKLEWSRYEPDFPFTYSWMEDRLADQYADEQRLTNIFSHTSFLALILACFGLFSVVSFATRSRTKEIGIRKSLGAHTHTIFFSFTLEFGFLLLIALLAAIPLAVMSIQHWLDSFAYRISLGVQPFIWSAFIVFAVALFSIAYQTYRAASVNPTISLRSQ